MMSSPEAVQELLDLAVGQGDVNWLDLVEGAGWEITPHARGTEFEIKYVHEPTPHTYAPPGDLIAAIRSGLPCRLVSPAITRCSSEELAFWTTDGEERSTKLPLVVGGRLKRKRHEIIHSPRWRSAMLRSSEHFSTIDRDGLDALISGDSDGTLRRERTKAYVLDTETLTVFNLVEDLCVVDGASTAVQVEIEYSAHLSRSLPRARLDPDAVAELLWSLNDQLGPLLESLQLVNSVCTKGQLARSGHRRGSRRSTCDSC